jgi:hypothetical protein
MSDEHWHYGTYRVINYPPEVLVRFSGPLPSQARAKLAIEQYVKGKLMTDPTLMAVIDLPPVQMLRTLGEWMGLPEESYLHVWPWCFEAFPCPDGDCEQAVFDNAVAMTAYFSEADIIGAQVVGRKDAFVVLALGGDLGGGGPERRVYVGEGECGDPLAGLDPATPRGTVGNVWKQSSLGDPPG